MLNRRALVKVGWTPALIAAVLGKPDRIEAHVKGYKRWVEHLYGEARVRQGESDPRYLDAMRRRRERAASFDRRRSEIAARYADWRAGLPEAAAGMFSLNRYAKHRTCTELHRFEIYELKNEFIRTLFERGYCRLSWIHRLKLPALKCRECGGDGGGWDCSRCDGSGVWRPERSVEYWCFQFEVGGKRYCWHQPRSLVQFTPTESVPPQDWEGMSGEKPVALPKRKFALVKALLRWVIDAAAAEAETPSREQAEALLL